MRIQVIVGFMAVLGLFGGAASAHHSFAAFDMKKEVRISGTVAEVQYTNPHVWLFVDVAAAPGGTESWAIEAGGPNILLRSGWKANTVKVGDKVEVTLHPMRDGKRGGSLIRIVLPDGKTIGG
jgi:uncharacterized protein DUF6152